MGRGHAAFTGLHPVLQGGPLLIAHRGGAGLAPENTLAAFESSARDWPIDMVELDVRATRDGHCIVMHDDTVDRTTSGTGPVADMTLADIKQLDAGYHFTRDGGRTFPFRGQGVTVPTFEEVLRAIPDTRITVEVKIGTAQTGMFAAIEKFNATARVIAAGMDDKDRDMFASYRGAISGSSTHAKRSYMAWRAHAGWLYRTSAHVLQIPEEWGGKVVVTPGFVAMLRRQNKPVHVWTVNDETSMRRLLDIGVDGLVTDRPDIAARLMGRIAA